MHLSTASVIKAVLLGSLASIGEASVGKRDFATIQNCLVGVQLAQQNLDATVRNQNVAIPQNAQAFAQSFADVESAMTLGRISIEPSTPLGLGEAQALLVTTDSAAASLKITTVSMILQQPTLDQLGLTGVAIQSLQSQVVLVGGLAQTTLARLPPEAIAAAQLSFGGMISTLQLGIAQLSGQGIVGVQVIPAGQIPVQAFAVSPQQCAAIGFVHANQFQVQQQNIAVLANQCVAIGFLPAQQIQQQIQIQQAAAQGAFVQQGFAFSAPQCAAIGFVPVNQCQNQQIVAQNCAALGFVQVGQVNQVNQVNQFQGQQFANVEQLQQCAAIGFVQPGQVQQGVSLANAEQLQQCAAIGFVQPNQGQVLGEQTLPQQAEQVNTALIAGQVQGQQGVANAEQLQQCAAIGFVSPNQGNAEQQQQQQQQQQVNAETATQTTSEQAQATNAEQGQQSTAEATQAARRGKAGGAKAQASRQEKRERAGAAQDPRQANAEQGQQAASATQTTAEQAAPQQTQQVNVEQAQQQQQGALSPEQCAALGLVQANQQQLAISPEQCAALGLVQQNQQLGQLGALSPEQCAALGLVPAQQINNQTVQVEAAQQGATTAEPSGRMERRRRMLRV